MRVWGIRYGIVGAKFEHQNSVRRCPGVEKTGEECEEYTIDDERPFLGPNDEGSQVGGSECLGGSMVARISLKSITAELCG